jgi:hypothetical protein
MDKLYKGLSAFANLANYGVGIAVAVTMIFKLDFVTVFKINSFTSTESLTFNMAMFQLGLMILGILIFSYAKDSTTQPKDFSVEFPISFAIVPAILGVIMIYFGIAGTTAREKALTIIFSLIYIAFSMVIIYFGTATFQLFKSESE